MSSWLTLVLVKFYQSYLRGQLMQNLRIAWETMDAVITDPKLLMIPFDYQFDPPRVLAAEHWCVLFTFIRYERWYITMNVMVI